MEVPFQSKKHARIDIPSSLPGLGRETLKEKDWEESSPEGEGILPAKSDYQSEDRQNCSGGS